MKKTDVHAKCENAFLTLRTNNLSFFFFHPATGSPAMFLDCFAPWNLFTRPLRLPVTAEVLVTIWQWHLRHNARLRVLQLVPGLEVPWKTGWSCSQAWNSILTNHVRYYWTCWIFGTDPTTTVCLKKTEFLKRSGVSQQALEQRFSLWIWPRIKQEMMSIVPLLNKYSWQLVRNSVLSVQCVSVGNNILQVPCLLL